MTTDSERDAINREKHGAAKNRLIQCSYAFAGILESMQSGGEIPDWHKENVRIWLRHHAAAAKARKEALGL